MSRSAETTKSAISCGTLTRKDSRVARCPKTISPPLSRLRPRSWKKERTARIIELSGRAGGDVGLHRADIRGKHVAALRPALDVVEACRTLWFPPERFLDRVGKLGRQGRLDADQRHAALAAFERDLDAVGGMRVDGEPVAMKGFANRRDPIG